MRCEHGPAPIHEQSSLPPLYPLDAALSSSAKKLPEVKPIRRSPSWFETDREVLSKEIASRRTRQSRPSLLVLVTCFGRLLGALGFVRLGETTCSMTSRDSSNSIAASADAKFCVALQAIGIACTNSTRTGFCIGL